ncbi:hypothetical protein RDV64_19140 [Acuticoccus sp. MNP-M23]|uniref:hypothetical protein n=1 Tax=Acuticoccus sp. MNP-M23 TaxID=3072793 RepID=UPI0028161B68|nr:hypothetical protein [Acuticoccus sp. MNP-M23]WMS42160.1 hypothetical protein RDV64_19140 [Acuticoccus sp. MNP-M23]
MTGTCYIVVNALPPHFGWLTRPDGLRAAQLAQQAREVFSTVRFVLFLERFNRLQAERRNAVLALARDDTIIIASAEFETFSSRIAPATFVFTNTDFAEEAGFAEQRHRIVYDITQLRALEVAQEGGGPDQVTIATDIHQQMLSIADRTFINSRALAERSITARLNRQSPVVDHAPDRHAVAARRACLIAGEAAPQRGDPGAMLAALTEHLRGAPETQALVIMPPPVPEAPHAMDYGALRLMANVTLLSRLSSVNDAEVLALGYGYVEWAPLAPTGPCTTSWRVLQAIAAGMPVLHQAGTGLDEYFSEFPGICLTGAITAADIAAFSERALRGEFDNSVARACRDMAEWRSDRTLFAGLA